MQATHQLQGVHTQALPPPQPYLPSSASRLVNLGLPMITCFRGGQFISKLTKELLPTSPAGLMSQSNFLFTNWLCGFVRVKQIRAVSALFL